MEAFNALPPAAAVAALLACADVPSWAEEVTGARPFAAPEDLVAHAVDAAARWTDADVDRALADHPRIGERHRGSGDSATASAREQAGVDPADAEVAERLAAGNARYEQRFDRVFLVRAAGRSAEEMLALLEQRLQNDPVTEQAAVKQQLREIATLRLGALVGSGDGSSPP